MALDKPLPFVIPNLSSSGPNMSTMLQEWLASELIKGTFISKISSTGSGAGGGIQKQAGESLIRGREASDTKTKELVCQAESPKKSPNFQSKTQPVWTTELVRKETDAQTLKL